MKNEKNPNNVSLPYCSSNPNPFAWPLGLSLSWFTAPGSCLGSPIPLAPRMWPETDGDFPSELNRPLLHKHPLLREPCLPCHHAAPRPSCLPLAPRTSTRTFIPLRLYYPCGGPLDVSCWPLCMSACQAQQEANSQPIMWNTYFSITALKRKKTQKQKFKQHKNKIKILFNIT